MGEERGLLGVEMRYGRYKKKFQELVDLAAGQGLKVEIVPDKVTYDFVGMNPLAARQLGFECPPRVIQIDDHLNWKEKYHTLKHELIELGLMSEGMSYGSAHKIALRYEK